MPNALSIGCVSRDSGEEGQGQNNLTVLALPYKVGLAFATALLVHLKPVHSNIVWVYLAT